MDPIRRTRRPNHGLLAVALACLVAGTAGCIPGRTPESQDPIVGASTAPGQTLPSPVGPVNCLPVSPVRKIADAAEIQGRGADGTTLWALVPRGVPIASGEQVTIVWRMPGVSRLALTAVAPGGEQIEASLVVLDPGVDWSRPGDAWSSRFTFPEPGCWRISARRGAVHGDVWLRVS